MGCEVLNYRDRAARPYRKVIMTVPGFINRLIGLKSYRLQQFYIRQVFPSGFPGFMRSEGFNHDRQGIRPNLRQIHLTEESGAIGNLLEGRGKAGLNAWPVSTRVDSIPAMLWQVNRNKTMQHEGRAVIVTAEPLVTKAGREPIGPQQSGQQMAFGKTIAGFYLQNL